MSCLISIEKKFHIINTKKFIFTIFYPSTTQKTEKIILFRLEKNKKQEEIKILQSHRKSSFDEGHHI